MEHLYAPWRSRYILKTRTGKEPCFLCRFAKEKKDERNLVLFRGESGFVVMNLFPYNDGHLLVCPNRHVGDPRSLRQREWGDLNGLFLQTLSALRRALRPDGFNTGMNLGKVAGAGVLDHLHIHVVPRWNGDTNFMPILAGTKLLNQDLRALYGKLKKAFRA